MKAGGFVGFFIRLECAAENFKLILGVAIVVVARRKFLHKAAPAASAAYPAVAYQQG